MGRQYHYEDYYHIKSSILLGNLKYFWANLRTSFPLLRKSGSLFTWNFDFPCCHVVVPWYCHIAWLLMPCQTPYCYSWHSLANIWIGVTVLITRMCYSINNKHVLPYQYGMWLIICVTVSISGMYWIFITGMCYSVNSRHDILYFSMTSMCYSIIKMHICYNIKYTYVLQYW